MGFVRSFSTEKSLERRSPNRNRRIDVPASRTAADFSIRNRIRSLARIGTVVHPDELALFFVHVGDDRTVNRFRGGLYRSFGGFFSNSAVYREDDSGRIRIIMAGIPENFGNLLSENVFEFFHLLRTLRHPDYLEADVRTVQRRFAHRSFDAEKAHDVLIYVESRGRGERENGNPSAGSVSDIFDQRTYVEVRKPEIMSPFAQAVGLVDGDHVEFCGISRATVEEFPDLKPFRSHVEILYLPYPHVFEDPVFGILVHSAVDLVDKDRKPELPLQVVALVFNERFKRRNDERRSRKQIPGKKKSVGLSGPGRKDAERPLSQKYGFDDFELSSFDLGID